MDVLSLRLSTLALPVQRWNQHLPLCLSPFRWSLCDCPRY